MKGRDWERLARRDVLPALGDGWTVRGSLIYRQPVEHILLGVQADTLYEATTLSLEAVVMPLYVPFPDLMYFIPSRLERIEVEDDRLTATQVQPIIDAVPFLLAHATPDLLLQDEAWKQPDDVKALEYETYSYLLNDEPDRAAEVLTAVRHVEPDDEPVGWEIEAVARCASIEKMLSQDASAAKRQLTTWEDENLSNLRLARTQ